MIFPQGATQRTSVKAASEDNNYDVVIVGSGIAGAIIAQELGKAGKRVLILEAGPGEDHGALTGPGREHVRRAADRAGAGDRRQRR